MRTMRADVFKVLSVLFVTLSIISLAIHIVGMRQRMLEDMQLHAVSAGKSMDKLPVNEDAATAMAERMGIWFESGDFIYITYTDLSGNTVVRREQSIKSHVVPDWFVSLCALPEIKHGLDIHQGDALVGSLELSVQPERAYESLWLTTKWQFIFYGFTAALMFWLVTQAMKVLLRPLKRMEEQAISIRDRHFVEVHDLPAVQELRHVAETMNCMSRRLKTCFDEQLALTEGLRAESYQDSVTGLSNRRDFNARLQGLSENEGGHGGVLLLLQISDFGGYNFKYGHESGDECLRIVAAHIQSITAATPDAIVSRRTGADFAVFLPGMDQEAGKALAGQLVIRVGELDVLQNHGVHVGLAACEILGQDHRLLSAADMALRQAQAQSMSGWKIYQEDDVLQVAREARQWYATLNRILLDRSLILHFQPVFMSRERESNLCEVFSRISMHGQVLPAGVFLPMSARFGLAAAFDRLILEEIFAQAERRSPLMHYCVNLSPQSLSNQEFLSWLDEWLVGHESFARRLIIETSEYLVRTGAEEMTNLCRLLHRHKARLSLDHFGVHSAAFGYLRSLPLDYLKIDRSFIRDIHQNKDSQFYVQSLVQIAHSCGIKVFAEGVELEAEWSTVLTMGIDGAQGYFLGRPAPEIVVLRQAPDNDDTAEAL
jgi:diguanylate cyclase (GGDEF)-like protein